MIGQPKNILFWVPNSIRIIQNKTKQNNCVVEKKIAQRNTFRQYAAGTFPKATKASITLNRFWQIEC